MAKQKAAGTGPGDIEEGKTGATGPVSGSGSPMWIWVDDMGFLRSFNVDLTEHDRRVRGDSHWTKIKDDPTRHVLWEGVMPPYELHDLYPHLEIVPAQPRRRTGEQPGGVVRSTVVETVRPDEPEALKSEDLPGVVPDGQRPQLATTGPAVKVIRDPQEGAPPETPEAKALAKAAADEKKAAEDKK